MRPALLHTLPAPAHIATRALLLVVLSLLAACGFQLRGSYALPYESIYLAMPEYSVVGADLRRAIRSSETTRLALVASDAQATFLPGTEYRDRIILSVSGTGRISELRLRYLYPYRVVDAKGRDLIAPGTIELIRDLTYDDSNVLAKQQEEVLLWRDMENDLVHQLMRRLAAAKPASPADPATTPAKPVDATAPAASAKPGAAR
ncbi:MAG: LPS-assembly lipoprotein RlpB [Candidatus Accumulibacter appositus]|uniref:LPS-assembly lipoprotein LptE n=1 Tax=Candidatus Accumulibacter appositus TaxID=1454003 RepID=A0A011QFI3_9PROT|nr:LPS assembly lipoprotein LptE [Accumulibacter sp.]EXI77569.1 MAG: LPS-assembly lipoprotein RlpB [Candidatus Accumulibacter appositus]HRF05409.1 LPS assembly lipoprotein LptE [Accumulibacter sp.]